MFEQIGARPAPEGNETNQISQPVNQKGAGIRRQCNLGEIIHIQHTVGAEDRRDRYQNPDAPLRCGKAAVQQTED